MSWGKVALILTGLSLTGAIVYAVTRDDEEDQETLPPPTLPEEEIYLAELRSEYVYWAALTDWRRVYTSFLNEWPADTDIQFVFEIKNTGNVGAYFQVYIFTPGNWLYLAPGQETTVYEDFHTPALPALPSYQYNNRITILARKLDGERIGSVWASEDFEIIYT